jgi:hypothetical protein
MASSARIGLADGAAYDVKSADSALIEALDAWK